MRLLSWMIEASCALSILGHLGCSSTEVIAPSPTDETASSTGQVAFASPSTLTLMPGESTQIAVTTSPGTAGEVSFVLLGDAENASISASAATTDQAGTASITLRAPDAPTTFRLRATIATGASAELSISVSEQGFGSLRVVPNYDGKRTPKLWTASVVARTTCAAIAPTLPDDPPGAIQAVADATQAPIVDGAPVGPNLAVVLRSGHYVWGCTDFTGLVAGATVSVDVNLLDGPVDLAKTRLDLGFDFAPDAAPYADIAHHAAHAILQDIFPAATTEATVLLDAMAQSLDGASKADFAARRVALAWDDAVSAYLVTKGVVLRDTSDAFAKDGFASEPATLTALVKGDADSADPSLFLGAIGTVSAKAAGVLHEQSINWAVNPGDILGLGAKIQFSPVRWVSALTLKGAQASVPGATSMGDALSTLVGCEAIATTLGPSASCDASCLAAACEQGLAERWSHGVDVAESALGPGVITVTATGGLEVDDDAVPTSLAGSWIGAVSDGLASANASGNVTGKSAP